MAAKRPRGHSNVYASETEPYNDLPTCACVPMIGGSRVDTCKPLPPLALHREDWEKIGRAMGWLPSNEPERPATAAECRNVIANVDAALKSSR